MNTLLLSKKITYLLVLSSVLLTGLHFVHFTNPLVEYHSVREIDTYEMARNFYEKNLPIWRPWINFRGGGIAAWEFQVYTYLTSLIFRIVGQESVLIARSVTILFAILSILLFHLIVQRIYRNTPASLLATFLYTSVPLRIYFGRATQPDTLMVFLGLMGIWCILKFLDNKKRKHFVFLSFGAVAISMLIKPYAVIFLVAVVWLYGENFQWLRETNRLGRVIKVTGSTLITLFPAFLYWIIVNSPKIYGPTVAGFQPFLENIALPGRENFRSILSGSRPAFFEFHPILLLLFLLSLRLRYTGRDQFLLPTFFSWATFGFLHMGAWLGNAHEFHILPAIPFLGIHAAKVFAESTAIQKILQKPKKLFFFLLITLTLTAFGSWILFRRTVKYAPVFLHQSNVIAEYADPNDVIVTNDYQTNHYLFFSRRRGYSIPAPRDQTQWTQKDLENLITRGARYLVITDYEALFSHQKETLMHYPIVYKEISPFDEEFRIYRLRE